MVPTPMMITYGHHHLLGSRPSVDFIKTWPTWISAQLPLDAYLSPSQPVVLTAPPMTLVTSTSPPIQYHPNTNIKWSPTHSQSAQPSRHSYHQCRTVILVSCRWPYSWRSNYQRHNNQPSALHRSTIRHLLQQRSTSRSPPVSLPLSMNTSINNEHQHQHQQKPTIIDDWLVHVRCNS